jgi:hypothetical protein
MEVGIFNEVWHRVWPLVPSAYQRFVDYYADRVVEPNKGLLDVLGGFRYLEGDTNADVTLYRYESIPAIANVSSSFGQDPSYIEATEALLSDLTIEETRTLAFPLTCSTSDRLEQTLAEEPATPRRYILQRRILPGAQRMRAKDLIGSSVDAVEKAGAARLVAAYEPLFGDVTRSTELWVLPEGVGELDLRESVETDLLQDLDQLAPACEIRRLEPLRYSRLR